MQRSGQFLRRSKAPMDALLSLHLALLAPNRSGYLALGTLEVHQVWDYLHIPTILWIKESGSPGGEWETG